VRSLFQIPLILAIVLPGVLIQPAAVHGLEREAVIGSKKFTESVILGEIVSGLARNAGIKVVHRKELGGTRVLWDALVKGEIDVYPEYTGTLFEEIFAHQGIQGEEGLRQALSRYGIAMTRSLGFNDNYAIGMSKKSCERLDIHRISDLRKHPELGFGFSNEFMARADGWPGLRSRYGLPQKNVFGMDHDLAVRGLTSGSVLATDLYTTDAEIAYYGLCVLEDDLHYFPVYTAVLLYRGELEKSSPGAVTALARLEGRISESDMIRMNELATIEKMPESRVAADFLSSRLSLDARVDNETVSGRLWRHTKEHLSLVFISLLAAIAFSIPLGIIAEKYPAWGQFILGFTGIVQTIPSLALLVFMIPLLGIGGPPAIVALFLYSLLPIVRNTYTGLRDIPLSVRESAEALGLPAVVKLRLVELPMASPAIMAGIKTSAVINVGTATLGALIGAGGYGQPILTGIRLNDVGLILQGAVPSAVLALFIQGAFELLELVVVPRGLRLTPTD
jgi:osmoprotectant transport system permease protein